MGEKSFTVSVWAKPEKLVPEMEYAFATAWYEASGVEEMQAVFDQDRIDESEFNKLTTINPKASKQLSIFPEGLTFGPLMVPSGTPSWMILMERVFLLVIKSKITP